MALLDDSYGEIASDVDPAYRPQLLLLDASKHGVIIPGQPFEFEVGLGDVIPGWDQGVFGMRVGGILPS